MTAARRLYLESFAASLGVERLDATATHVRIEEERAGANLIVGYALGSVTLVRAAPEHADLVAPLAAPNKSLSFDDLRSWAAGVGWVDFDGSRAHVVDPGNVREAPIPAGLRAVTLDPRATDNDRVVAWLDAADPDDVDQAEFETDEFDERMVALVDAAGGIAALASSRPWEEAPRFEDIGVLVAPSHRQRGAGRAVVRSLLDSLHADDQRGLYRCNWTNPASRALALGVGFDQVTDLIALCPAGDPKASTAEHAGPE